jgi:hypothetical protein
MFKFDPVKEEFVQYAILIENIQAIDPSLVFWNDKYWIFCGLKNRNPNESLFAYYADQLTGPYEPHRLNPVKTDPRGSRPAGTMLTDGDVLLRPAQYSVDHYGQKILLQSVQTLTGNRFEENPMGEFAPQSSWEHSAGLHTWSVSDALLCFDRKKHTFVWAACGSAVRRKLGITRNKRI